MNVNNSNIHIDIDTAFITTTMRKLSAHVLHPLQHAADVVEIKSLAAQTGCGIFEILLCRWQPRMGEADLVT